MTPVEYRKFCVKGEEGQEGRGKKKRGGREPRQVLSTIQGPREREKREREIKTFEIALLNADGNDVIVPVFRDPF